MEHSLEQVVKEVEGCLWQQFRPFNYSLRVPIYGVGDCEKCTPHPDNKNCARYVWHKYKVYNDNS